MGQERGKLWRHAQSTIDNNKVIHLALTAFRHCGFIDGLANGQQTPPLLHACRDSIRMACIITSTYELLAVACPVLILPPLPT